MRLGFEESIVSFVAGGLFFFERRIGFYDLHASDSVAVWIGGCVVWDGFDDSRRDHVYREEPFAEGRVLRVDGVHVVYSIDESWDVDLIDVQAEDAMEVSFDAGDGVDAEPG